MKTILKSRTGMGYPLTAAVTLALLMLLLVITEYAHLMIIAAGIKDALQEAVISTVNDNYADVYHAVREGYAAGFQPYGDGDFEESLDYGDIYGRLDELLGLQEESDYHVCLSESGQVEYRIKNLSVEINNNDIGSGQSEGFGAEATVRLWVPVRFVAKILPDMRMTVRAKAEYTPKF